MDFFDSSISINPQANVTAIEQQQTEVTPVSQLVEGVASLSVYDYLGGLAISLIFMAIWRMITEKVEKPKSKRRSDIELLERIWQMDTSKIGE